ncbi:MAG: Hsp20/alpha crystallin family protein [Thermomicrobiales bacterium]
MYQGELALSMQHWESTNETMSLSDALAAISEEKFVPTPARRLAIDSDRSALALDVLETPDVFEIHASVPGLAPEQLDITVLGDGVRIAGENAVADTGRATEESDYRWLVRERPLGRFDRSVSLPSAFQPDLATATVDNGVLIVTLPKAALVEMHVIPVRTTNGRHHGATIEIEGAE